MANTLAAAITRLGDWLDRSLQENAMTCPACVPTAAPSATQAPVPTGQSAPDTESGTA